jgi:sulfur relay (sulfurtransferase) complex TusBCD TusD component (DsrE family)
MGDAFSVQLLAQNWLSSASALCHQSGMATTKKSAAAVACERVGGLKGGKARAALYALSTLKDLYEILRDSDRLVTF